MKASSVVPARHLAAVTAIFWFATTLTSIGQAPSDPPSALDPFTSPLLSSTPATTLLVSFDADGQPVVNPGSQAEMKGSYKPLPADRELPGAKGIVRIPADLDNDESQGWLEINHGADLLTQGPFTLDMVMRVSRRADSILQAGDATHPLRFALIDRDAGWVRLVYPTDQGKSESLEVSGVFETPGPLRQDRYQVFTLAYDGKGTLYGYIDGLPSFDLKLKGVKGALPLGEGPLIFGSYDRWKSHFQGDLAQLRIQSTFAPPQLRQLLPLDPAVFGWRFDFGPDGALTEPGWLRVTPGEVPALLTWSSAPTEGYDAWFFPDRYKASPEAATKQHTRRAADWVRRDGLLVPAGGSLHIDVPAGSYAVSVIIGDNRNNTTTAEVTANGKVIGRDLVINVDNTSYPLNRTARGIVTVDAGQGLDIDFNTVSSKGPAPTHLQGVIIEPIAPLPVSRQGGKLVWVGSGKAPAGFDQAAELYSARDFSRAFEAAGQISDPVARNSTRAWIMGYPRLVKGEDVYRLVQMQEDLVSAARTDPDNIALRYLLSSTNTMYNAALGYAYQWSNGVIYGPNKGRPWRISADLALSITPEEPWYGNAHLLAGSAIWQGGQQSGGYTAQGEWLKPSRHHEFATPIPIFQEVLEVYPDASLAHIFLGEEVPVEKQIPIPEGAPEWAALQHRALIRLLDTLHYWHDERMDEGGLMGGGFGDDVEMMRWWNVAILAADDAKARDGWNRLTATGWKNLRRQPLGDKMSDAEHAAEDFSDSHSLQPLLQFGKPQFEEMLQRNRLPLPLFKNVLMDRSADGHLMFKSHVYSINASDPRPGDVPYNIRTMLPLIWYCYFRPDDTEATEVVTEYARSWKDVTMAATDGKPAGITPMMVRMDDHGKLRLDSSGNYSGPLVLTDGSTDWVYPGYWSYAYPNGYTNNIYDLCLAAYDLTGDPAYLEPLKKAAEFIRNHQDLAPTAEETMPHGGVLGSTSGHAVPPASEGKERGSLEWAIAYNWSGLAHAAAQYRLATGDTSFDDVLLKHGGAAIRTQIGTDQAQSQESFDAAVEPMNEVLRATLKNLDYNEILRTELGQSTDRIWVPGSQAILAGYTGMIAGVPPLTRRGAELQWPTFAVTWEETGPDISALVTHNQKDGLTVMLYNFAETPKDIALRVWRLNLGKYRLTLSPARNLDHTDLKDEVVDIREKGQRIELHIPAREELRLSLKSVELSARDN